MPHLDEGTLHALLDGELELAEVKEIQTHLGACAACGSRLQDVKQFLAEADRLVGALEIPAGSARTRREPDPLPQAPPSPGANPWREPVWDAAPELLLPEDPQAIAHRTRWTRRFRWAAMILVVLGAGQLVRNTLGRDELDLLSDREVNSAAPTPPAVVSAEESRRPEQRVTKQSRPAPVDRPKVTRPVPPPKLLADRPAPDTVRDELDTMASIAEDTATPVSVGLAAAERADADSEVPQTAPVSDLATRQAAAAALEELDRERLRSRAAAATAALPPARPDPAPAAEVAPAPRTLEQKAQVYLRIGLDEANKQLGRPMHVIEAMTPEFIGLAQGRQVSGADPSRPVVRVVYRDARGRMILLDQQRLRTGQAPGAASGNLRWTRGDVMLYLHGEPSGDALRALQRRVR